MQTTVYRSQCIEYPLIFKPDNPGDVHSSNPGIWPI